MHQVFRIGIFIFLSIFIDDTIRRAKGHRYRKIIFHHSGSKFPRNIWFRISIEELLISCCALHVYSVASTEKEFFLGKARDFPRVASRYENS